MSTRRTVLKRLGAAAVVTTGVAVAGRTTASAAVGDEEIQLDSFTGTDDQKLTAALDLARNSNPRRPIRLSAHSYTFSQTRTTFSGLRILGPNVGWQNPEIANTAGALPQCTVTLNCGNGANSWLVGAATTYDVMVAGITFKSSNAVTQFYHHPYSAGTSFATTLDTLSFYGFKHVLGTPADPFSMTLVTTRGSWTCVAVQDTQFSLRGSDNFLWVAGDLNYGWQGANQGRYLMRFSNLSKTAVKHLYLTARGGSRAVLVEATAQGGLDFSDCVIEGQNANDQAMGALIVTKGQASFTNIKLNFGMARPSDFTDQADTAYIMVLGGTALIANVWVNKANKPGTSTQVAETVPVVDVRGGTAYVSTVIGCGSGWATKPLAKASGGTLVADQSLRTG
ncbi:hypothetical protein [Phycicoccus sp. Soil802]|uniref:hypothetical protein n=1 Tax=Phycicoccus sp. Soil802 TaxID=1736414 RepID=UPI000B25633A|nr:hypothetical protein [Phycicoccus sp. Soil802]